MYRQLCIRVCMAGLALVGGLYAQQPAPPAGDEDPLGQPTQRGIRMTPGMARALGRIFAKEVLVRQHEMDAAKADEAAELVARRLMSAAHAIDANGAALGEVFITKACNADADSRTGGGPDEVFTPEFQKEMAQQILPALPAIRDLIGGVGRDIMPMLPIKQQLKLSAELAAAGMGINGFEQNMQRWARGEGQAGENPFSDAPAGKDAMKKDASGQSAALKAALDAAGKEMDKQDWIRRIWENYLKEFKKFYALDDGQCATADSLLREYLERARLLMQDANWRDQIYRSRLWLNMAMQLKMHPAFTNILNSRYEEAMAPINTLGDEFRLKLEEIPTAAQKETTEARIAAALKERGYEKPETK